ETDWHRKARWHAQNVHAPPGTVRSRTELYQVRNELLQASPELRPVGPWQGPAPPILLGPTVALLWTQKMTRLDPSPGPIPDGRGRRSRAALAATGALA